VARTRNRESTPTDLPEEPKFSLEEPQYYQYNYTSSNTSAVSGSFEADAYGDLNGNGVTSDFTIIGSATSGAIAISPNIQEVNPEE